MRPIRWLVGVVRNLMGRGRLERELEEELASYVTLLADEKERAGLSPAEARRAALLEVGGVEGVKEGVREVRAGAALETAARDLRHGGRALARAPGFTAAVVVSLALGVGATTVLFGVVDAVLLRPLPYPDPGRLQEVRVWWGDFSATLSPADLAALEAEAGGVAEVAGYWFPDGGLTWMTPGGPEVVRGVAVTTELPEVLGARPLLGRTFSADAGSMEALVSERFWRERLGGAAEALGRVIELDGDATTVVGVMPSGFGVPGEADGEIWVRFEPRPPTRRGPFYFRTIARLAPGLDGAAAATRLTDLAVPVLRDRFGVTEEWRYGLRPLKESVVGDVRPTLGLLLAGAVLVLLVSVLNVTNLLLARGTARARELGVRAALGAGRGRLAGQLLAEAALLGALGGGLGLALAAAGLGGVRGLGEVVPRIGGAVLDLRVAAFALGIGIVAGAAAGLLPALRLPWSALSVELREGGRGAGAGRRHAGARRLLVMAEVALTLTVLASAGLLAKSLLRLESQDPGFDPEGVLSFRVSLADPAYRDEEAGPARLAAFLARVEGELEAAPGVSEVAFASALPPDQLQMTNNYSVEGQAPAAGGPDNVAEWLVVTPDYFRALGIPLARGRTFTESDREGAPGTVVVNDAFARRHFGAEDPLGRRIQGGDPDPEGEWLTIVGVVGDVPYAGGAWTGSSATVYTPYARNPWMTSPFVVARTAGDPAALVPAARRAVAAADPRVPLRQVATMTDRVHDSAASPRLRSLLFAVLAGVALALAWTGIYGLIAYDVGLRRRDTAVRRALGASARAVARGVVLSGMRLAAAGGALGLVGAVAAARLLRSVLYGVDPVDPAVIAGSAAVILAAALAACVVPAARAIRLDPMAVLRED